MMELDTGDLVQLHEHDNIFPDVGLITEIRWVGGMQMALVWWSCRDPDPFMMGEPFYDSWVDTSDLVQVQKK